MKLNKDKTVTALPMKGEQVPIKDRGITMKKALIPGFVALLSLAGTAYATNEYSQLQVSMTVLNTCTVSAASLVFPFDTESSDTSQVTVNCANNLPYQVGLGAGQNSTSSPVVSARAMADGNGNFVSYSLYRDAAMLNLWGDFGLGNTYTIGQPVTGTGNGADQVLTVYGLSWWEASGSPPAGTYADTVTVMVTF